MGSHGNEITSSDSVILNLQGMYVGWCEKSLNEVEWDSEGFSYGLTVNTRLTVVEIL